MTKKRFTKAQQNARDAFYYKAADLFRAMLSHKEIGGLTKTKFMGSGVVISIHNLYGLPIVEPTVIKDGLSDATIAALQADLKETQDLAIALGRIPEVKKNG